MDADSLFCFVSDETVDICGSSPPEVFLRKGVLKMLLYDFIEIALQNGCSPFILKVGTSGNEQ